MLAIVGSFCLKSINTRVRLCVESIMVVLKMVFEKRINLSLAEKDLEKLKQVAEQIGGSCSSAVRYLIRKEFPQGKD